MFASLFVYLRLSMGTLEHVSFGVCVHMHICMRTHMFDYLVCMCVHKYVSVQVCVRKFVQVSVRIKVCNCTHVCACECAHV